MSCGGRLNGAPGEEDAAANDAGGDAAGSDGRDARDVKGEAGMLDLDAAEPSGALDPSFGDGGLATVPSGTNDTRGTSSLCRH